MGNGLDLSGQNYTQFCFFWSLRLLGKTKVIWGGISSRLRIFKKQMQMIAKRQTVAQLIMPSPLPLKSSPKEQTGKVFQSHSVPFRVLLVSIGRNHLSDDIRGGK